MLHEARHLFASQMHRRSWSDGTLRACQKALSHMTQSGWVRRFRFVGATHGAQQFVYCLTEEGFNLTRSLAPRTGASSDREREAGWREPPSEDPAAVLRDLHVAGWILALRSLAPNAVRNWRGTATSKVMPPRRHDRGKHTDLRPADIRIPGGRQLRDLGMDRLESVNPAATIEVRLRGPDGPIKLDMLIDLDRSRGAAYNERKLQRYDAFLAGWYHMVDRYRRLDAPPIVVIVCEDEQQASRYVRTADNALTARLARAGDPEQEWPCPSRRQMLFVCERDLHAGSLAALAPPAQPPALRAKLGDAAENVGPRRVQLVDRSRLVSAD
jgi:hypothetical protein